MKQGPENTELVKDDSNPKRNYIFQSNSKTKIAAFIVIGVLLLLVIGLVVSGTFLDQK